MEDCRQCSVVLFFLIFCPYHPYVSKIVNTFGPYTIIRYGVDDTDVWANYELERAIRAYKLHERLVRMTPYACGMALWGYAWSRRMHRVVVCSPNAG